MQREREGKFKLNVNERGVMSLRESQGKSGKADHANHSTAVNCFEELERRTKDRALRQEGKENSKYELR